MTYKSRRTRQSRIRRTRTCLWQCTLRVGCKYPLCNLVQTINLEKDTDRRNEKEDRKGEEDQFGRQHTVLSTERTRETIRAVALFVSIVHCGDDAAGANAQVGP